MLPIRSDAAPQLNAAFSRRSPKGLTQMKIERVAKLSAIAIAEVDFSIIVSEEAVPPFDGSKLNNIRSIPEYGKTYPQDDALFEEADARQRMIAVAQTSEGVVGYVAISRSWNQCAQIDDIMISRNHRRRGLGRLLMDEAIQWAKEERLTIVRLETQTNNVPTCRFYEKYGFTLGGFDRCLYSGLPLSWKHETALFWYLHLP